MREQPIVHGVGDENDDRAFRSMSRRLFPALANRHRHAGDRAYREQLEDARLRSQWVGPA